MNRQNLQTVRMAYPRQTYDQALVADDDKQLLVHSASVFNAMAAPTDVGVAHTLTDAHWKIFEKQTANTDVTATAQAESGVVTAFSTTNNEGFYIQATRPFELLSYTIDQEETGSPVYVYKYYNGSGFATLPLINVPHYDSDSAVQHIAFHAPLDWAVGNGGEAGLDADKYTIQVYASTAPSQAVQIASIKVARFVFFKKNVAAYQNVQALFNDRKLLLHQGEAILGYFAAANADNTLEVSYQISP